MMWNDSIEQVKINRASHSMGGGEKKIQLQNDHGKMTVWQRISVLLDEDSFTEINSCVEADPGLTLVGDATTIPGDGVVTGWGTISGRKVCVAAEDFTVLGGTLGAAHAHKIARLQDLALEMQAPVIFLYDCEGARIQEGLNALEGYGEMIVRHTKASGVIPQISAILGPCCAEAACSPALCDFVFVVRGISHMYLTGPDGVESVTGKRPDEDALGGADMHSTLSGTAHALYNDEVSCLKGIRRLLQYLPSNCRSRSPLRHDNAGSGVGAHDLRVTFESIVPDNMRKPYDMHQVIENIMDIDEPLFEIQKHYARNAIVGFSYLNNHPVGVVANQPIENGGAIDINASDKMARFIRFCDSFHIPLLSLVDVPAFQPGVDQEQQGIIRHGARMLYAFSSASVPKITVVLRKAYGGAYLAMNSLSLGADFVYAWPIAQIAVTGAESAVNLLYKDDLRRSGRPDQTRAKLKQTYEEQFLNPETARKRGFVSEVILPEETRGTLIRAFDFLEDKKQNAKEFRHGNIPL